MNIVTETSLFITYYYLYMDEEFKFILFKPTHALYLKHIHIHI